MSCVKWRVSRCRLCRELEALPVAIFQLEVRAFDLGEPSLDSTVSILIRVRQVVTVSPESGVGFAELEHRVDLAENVERGGLVATLPLEKKPPVEKRLRIRYVKPWL